MALVRRLGVHNRLIKFSLRQMPHQCSALCRVHRNQYAFSGVNSFADHSRREFGVLREHRDRRARQSSALTVNRAFGAVCFSFYLVVDCPSFAAIYHFSRNPWGSPKGAAYNEWIDDLYDRYLPYPPSSDRTAPTTLVRSDGSDPKKFALLREYR